MQTYVVRVYRSLPEDEASVSGVIEEIESGKKQSFNSLIDLQSKLAQSIGKDQLELSDMAIQESSPLEHVA
jgi:hypothetical protein